MEDYTDCSIVGAANYSNSKQIAQVCNELSRIFAKPPRILQIPKENKDDRMKSLSSSPSSSAGVIHAAAKDDDAVSILTNTKESITENPSLEYILKSTKTSHVDSITKNIGFIINEIHPVITILSVTKQVDLKLLEKALRNNCSSKQRTSHRLLETETIITETTDSVSIRLATAEECIEIFGYPPGTVCVATLAG